MKAAISDRLIEITVKPMCRTPTSAARIGVRLFSMLRWMFSIITMASSTTKPTEIVTAISDMLSSEKPTSHIAAKVPPSDSGTVIAAANVAAARRRNRNTTIVTKPIEIASIVWMSWTEARIIIVRSRITSKRTPAGAQRSMSGSAAFTASTVSMTLASGCLVTLISTPGRLFTQPALRLLRTPCSTTATSCTRIIVPFFALTTIRPKAFGSNGSRFVAIVS